MAITGRNPGTDKGGPRPDRWVREGRGSTGSKGTAVANGEAFVCAGQKNSILLCTAAFAASTFYRCARCMAEDGQMKACELNMKKRWMLSANHNHNTFR